ncbi:MAG: hypothetical protein IJ358_02595 [Clostridia bacterium]|nr:hypothetical protein [Clostridia bacterium]
MEKNNNQQLVDEMENMGRILDERRKNIEQIANSDNYLEEMLKINKHLNETRKNKKTVSYAKLKKVFDNKEGKDGE